MIRPHPQIRGGEPQPDSPAQPSPAPPGVPSPDQKPEIGPMGEPPGVPSPTPGPQHDNDLPHTIDPLGSKARGRPCMPVPMRLRPGARPAVNLGRGR